MPTPPFYPIIVGVTGHRDIAPGAEDALRSAMRALLIALHAKFLDALYVMTALADGADQLIADVAADLTTNDGKKASPKIIAVSPMSFDTYHSKVSDKAKLTHHWNRATLKLELPDLSSPSDPGYDELQYEQLGVLLSRRSHLLLALWDGLSSSEPRGGTASVVRIRQEGEHTLAKSSDRPLFRHTGLFAEAFSRLDLSPGGPILQIVTPQARTGGDTCVPGRSSAKPGDCFLLPASNDEPKKALPKPVVPSGAIPVPPETVRELPGPNHKSTVLPMPVAPDGVFAALPESVREDFNQIAVLNLRIAKFRGPDRRIFTRQVGYLSVADITDPDGEPGEHLGRLREWQAAADTAAQYYQRRLLGQYVPARSSRDMIVNGWKALRLLYRPPRIGIVLVFAAAVPIAVAMFESYAHLGRSPWMLGLYLAVFAGAAAFYQFHVKRRALQNSFQDYRALAEAMRVQLFGALAAAPVAVADNYLRMQSGELGWIQFALRGPALWAAALALKLEKPHRELVTKGWIEDQLSYYSDKATLHEHAANRGRLWAKRFLFLGLGLSLSLAVIETLRLALGVHGPQSDGIWHDVAEAQEWLLVLAATAPALAAFFTVSVDLRAYEAHAHSYALMGSIFARAEQVAADANDADEFRALVRELGREALAENAEWLLDHRHRPIEHQ